MSSASAEEPPVPTEPAAAPEPCGTTTTLIQKGQEGDAVALGELFRRYQAFALGAASRPYLSPTDQEVVAGDALGSVLIRLSDFPHMDGRDNLRALLRTFIQRKIGNLIRERTRKGGNFGRGYDPDDDGRDAERTGRDPDPAEQAVLNEIDAAVEDALARFADGLWASPGGEAHAVVLADMRSGRTVEETAAAQGCATRTVVRRRDIVIRRLAEFCAAYGFEISEDAIRAVLRCPRD